MGVGEDVGGVSNLQCCGQPCLPWPHGPQPGRVPRCVTKHRPGRAGSGAGKAAVVVGRTAVTSPPVRETAARARSSQVAWPDDVAW